MSCYRQECCTYGTFCWKSFVWMVVLFSLFVVMPSAIWQNKINKAYHHALSEWNENAPHIVAHNQFWQMVAGEQNLKDTPTGLLAGDIRCLIITSSATQQERTSAFRRLVTGNYGGLSPQIVKEIFSCDVNGKVAGLSGLFWNEIDEFTQKGASGVFWKEPPKPSPDDPQYQRYNVWEKEIFWWLVIGIWLVASTLVYSSFARLHFNKSYACLCDTGVPSYSRETGTRWNLKGEEGHWQLLTILLLLPFFLAWLSFLVVREIFLFGFGNDRSLVLQTTRKWIEGARSWNRERTHPYRHEKATLQRSIESLKGLQASSPEPDGDISQELKRIEALVLELDQLPQQQRQASEREREEMRRAARLARIVGDVDEVQSTVEAHKEVGASP